MQDTESLNYEQYDSKLVAEKNINISLNTYNTLPITKARKRRGSITGNPGTLKQAEQT